jgi:hypothetical protein
MYAESLHRIVRIRLKKTSGAHFGKTPDCTGGFCTGDTGGTWCDDQRERNFVNNRR